MANVPWCHVIYWPSQAVSAADHLFSLSLCRPNLFLESPITVKPIFPSLVPSFKYWLEFVQLISYRIAVNIYLFLHHYAKKNKYIIYSGHVYDEVKYSRNSVPNERFWETVLLSVSNDGPGVNQAKWRPLMDVCCRWANVQILTYDSPDVHDSLALVRTKLISEKE